MTATSTYGRTVVISATNKSGGGLIAGDVCVIDTTNNLAFTTDTSGGFTGTVGIAQGTIANSAAGLFAISGYVSLVNVNASVTRGHYGKTYTVAKQATDAGASRGVGTFCEFTTGGTTPDAIMWPVDLLGSSLTNPMTTSQDIIVGGSSGTPGRLAVGAAGAALSVINAAVAWNSGTSFPGSKLTGDRYWRTDLGMEAYWDGTRWVTTQLFRELLTGPLGYSSVTTIARFAPWSTSYDLWLDALWTSTYVATTNNGSNYWPLILEKADAADARTTLASFNTSADTVNNWTQRKTSIGAAYVAASYREIALSTQTATGAPGTLFIASAMSYRLILT